MSADPLSVHSLRADPNAYAYVSGAALRASDPSGLDGADINALVDVTSERLPTRKNPIARERLCL